MAERQGQNGKYEPELARLAAASALDTEKVPALQFGEI
jgi:hypothetical protein